MHIAIVVPRLHGGGAETVAREWVAELRAHGHAVTVYAYARDQPNADPAPGAVVHVISPRGGFIRPARMPLWLHIRIRRDRPDVVVSLLPFSNVIAWLALRAGQGRSVPLLVSEHNVPSLQVTNDRRRDKLTEWAARRLYRHAAGVLTVSHPIAGEIVSAYRVPADRIFVVPNPVVQVPADAAPAKRDLPERLHLVCVGRQVNQKRPRLFLEVLHELAQRGVSVRGTVVGDGPLRDSTELESSRLGLDVAFLGWREPWWEAVSDVDCLVNTANAEGFANVLVEAAAAGIPAVASSRAMGVADAIIPGITGELALEDSPRAYADAVLSAAPLVLTGAIHLGGWLNRFSIANSTAALMSALQAITDPDRPS